MIPTARASSNDLNIVAVLMAGLICLAAASQDWLSSSLSLMDAGRFVGLFTFYDRPDFRPDDYKTARVVYLIYNHLIYRLAGTPARQVVAALVPIMLCVGLAYLTLRAFVAATPAFLAAALLSLSPPFHDLTGGGFYNNIFSGVWYCLALLLIVRRPFSHAEFASGACYLVAVSSNLYMLLLLPVFGLLFLLRWRGDRLGSGVAWRDTLQGGCLFMAGALAAFAAIGVTNRLAFGRPLWFMRPQIAFIRSYIGSSHQNEWGYHPYRSFWPGNDPTGWVYVFLFATCIVALIFAGRLLARRHRGHRLVWNALLCTGLFVALNLSGTMTMFPVHLAHALFLPGYLALGVMLAPLTASAPRLSARGAILLYAGMSAPLLLAGIGGAGMLAASGLACAAVAAVNARARIAALAICLASAAVLATPQAYRGNYNPLARCHGDRDAYRAADRVVALTREIEPNPRNVRVWFDASDAFLCDGRRLATPIYLSDRDLGSADLWSTNPAVPVAAIYDGVSSIPRMPAIAAITKEDVGWAKQPGLNRVLLAITRNRDDGPLLVARLASLGVNSRIAMQREIDEGSVSYVAIWLALAPD